MKIWWKIADLAGGFNRINSDRSIPTHVQYEGGVGLGCQRFNRINSDRSIPTGRGAQWASRSHRVSIVSIQTDQSRLRYNRYPSGRIIMFQSYQFRQINPDSIHLSLLSLCSVLVSIVSIQTDQSRHEFLITYSSWILKVSIVSIQTDQSRRIMINTIRKNGEWVSIVSIQTDQSRPVLKNLPSHWNWLTFQSYQFRQINPDLRRVVEESGLGAGVSIVSIQTDQSRLEQHLRNLPCKF